MRHLRSWCWLLSCLLLLGSSLTAAADQIRVYLPLATLQVPIRPGPPIAFITSPPGDIFLIHPDRTGLVRVSFGLTATMLAWSPDGTRIAFISNGAATIAVLRLQDRRVTTLLRGEGAFVIWDPAWSPDGSQIAFVKGTPTNKPQIAVMQADGTQARVLTAGIYPSWSPDGRQIAFTADVDGQGNGIFVMQADGSQQRLITQGGNAPVWSPDGSAMAYWSSNGQLMTMRPDGTREIAWPAFTSIPVHRPTWSPDSTRIAYVNYYNGPRIYVIYLDGTGKYEVLARATAPAWAPR